MNATRIAAYALGTVAGISGFMIIAAFRLLPTLVSPVSLEAVIGGHMVIFVIGLVAGTVTLIVEDRKQRK